MKRKLRAGGQIQIMIKRLEAASRMVTHAGEIEKTDTEVTRPSKQGNLAKSQGNNMIKLNQMLIEDFSNTSALTKPRASGLALVKQPSKTKGRPKVVVRGTRAREDRRKEKSFLERWFKTEEESCSPGQGPESALSVAGEEGDRTHVSQGQKEGRNLSSRRQGSGRGRRREGRIDSLKDYKWPRYIYEHCYSDTCLAPLGTRAKPKENPSVEQLEP